MCCTDPHMPSFATIVWSVSSAKFYPALQICGTEARLSTASTHAASWQHLNFESIFHASTFALQILAFINAPLATMWCVIAAFQRCEPHSQRVHQVLKLPDLLIIRSILRFAQSSSLMTSPYYNDAMQALGRSHFLGVSTNHK